LKESAMTRNCSRRLTRRSLLKAVVLAGGLASCGKPYKQEQFRVPALSAVCILDAPDYGSNLSDTISRGLRELQIDLRGLRVLLKPNLIEYEADRMINTQPAVVGAAALAMIRSGAKEVIVGEGPGHRRDVEYLLRASGLGEVLRDLHLGFIDLNHDAVRLIKLRSDFSGLGSIYLPQLLYDVDLVVSMPKLKTHHWAGMTAGMKNLFGIIPGAIYGWPKNPLHLAGINECILDINATIRPGLTIVDAIVSMEGDGPIMGSAKQTGFLAMGRDVVSVDGVCARIMRLAPERIPYLAKADFLGNIDEARVDQRAECPRRYSTAFQVVDHLKNLQID
jgi:uncharacterized protein (DUF362 family)